MKYCEIAKRTQEMIESTSRGCLSIRNISSFYPTIPSSSRTPVLETPILEA
jgi:hypothetical protein